ncbi:MAG: rhodanese-like domain-containing protein [Moraxellaceae bacterium]
MSLPLLLEPEVLNAHLQDANLLIVDLGKESVYQQAHVPGAILVNGKQLVSGELPAPGRLPPVERLIEAFSAMGLTPDTHVVVYDDEGGGWAGRFIWTLDAIGHRHYSYLNGGIHAWLAAGLPVENTPNAATPSQAVVSLQAAPVADADYVLAHLRDADHVIWDARSPEEYAGTRILAQRGGHIPGAQHYEWTRAMDRANALRVRPLDEVRAELAAIGITGDKTVITHCQTHHRSGFTYLVGKLLGFEKLKGYAGSWSEWGNRSDTPVET